MNSFTPGPRAKKPGEYEGTVRIWHFVVPLRHCHRRSSRAVWGCVGKIRASHFSVAVLPF